MSVTVVSVEEEYEFRGIKVSEDGVITAQRQWEIHLDLSAATPTERDTVESLVEAQVPVARYDSHPAYPEAWARSIVLKPAGAQDLWTATVDYSSARIEASPSTGSSGITVPTGTGGDSPRPTPSQDSSTPATSRLPQFSRAKKTYKFPLEVDVLTGSDVLNKAGDPFDPPIEVDRSLQIINIKLWRLPSWTLYSTLDTFYDKINASAVTMLGRTYADKTLRVIGVTDSLVWDTIDAGGGAKQVGLVIEVNIQLEYDPNTHRVKVLNAGKRARPSAGADPATITDGTGQPTSDPIPLAADGTKLAAGADKVYLFFQGYSEADISQLWA